MSISKKQKDINQYYEDLSLVNIKRNKNVKNELLYQLFKKPKERIVPQIEPTFQDDTHQYDLLYLPHDKYKGKTYKYALVGVDVGSRLCDAEPLTTKTSKEVLEAVIKMYKRNKINMPYNKINVDSGTEFKNEFAKYFINKNVNVVVGMPNRHRQVALVEARNGEIGNYLLKRMVAQELKTGEPSHEWVEWLPKLITKLNKTHEIKNPKPIDNFDIACSDKSCQLLEVGQLVRTPLDRPIDVVTGKPIDSKFRSADVKYNLQPSTIDLIKFSSINQPMYHVKGYHAFYTKDQLQVVGESNMPPSDLQSKFIVEKIISKKKIKGVVNYLIKWKDYDNSFNSYEPRQKLINEGLKHMINKYENK